MRDPFNERKATQAASRFLRLSNGRMNYMVLIKLIYLLDRESLIRWGRPAVFDEYFSMHDGPVVSKIHELITEMPWPEELNFWIQHISPPSNWDVRLIGDAGNDQLSEAEEKLIDELFAEYGHYDDPFKLVKRLHDELGEWMPVQRGQRAPITIEQILLAGKKSAKEIRAIEEDLNELQLIHSFLSSR
jgi:hypothetical protein